MTKLNPIIFNKAIKEKELKLFSPLDITRIFGVSYDTARKFLLRYVKKGFITKLRNGLYILSEQRPSEFLIANKLYSPSYVSLETALSHHHIIPETIYTITSVTTKPSREFVALSLSFTYQKIKKQAFTGYEFTQTTDGVVLLADPEKALIDYLYFVVLGRKTLNDRTDINTIGKKKAISYAQLFAYPKLISLVKQIL